MEESYLYPHKDYLKRSQDFTNLYNLVDAILPGSDRFSKLKPKRERSCRFCGRSHPHAKFKSVAHLIPELLGNKELLSDFECETCNKVFGTYENELARYLSIYRTLTGTKAKDKTPSFKSAGAEVQAKMNTVLGSETLIISREDYENGAIKVDAQTGKTTIRFKKNPYTPIKVYKALLKIALSVIDEKEIKSDYRHALNFLMGKNVLLTGCILSGYLMPFTFKFPTPHIFLFKKKHPLLKTHTHVMALYVQNMVFSLPVPLNNNDYFFFNNQSDIKYYPYPPFFASPDSNTLSPQYFQDDFSSEEKVRGEIDEIVFELNPEDLKEAMAYDTKTGQTFQSAFTPSEIMKIVVRSDDAPINPKDFTDALE